MTLKAFVKAFFTGLAAAAGVIIVFVLRKSADTETGTEVLSQADIQKAESAKTQKEQEIEKTDSLDLLSQSSRADNNSAAISSLNANHRSRVRDRIRSQLQRK